MGKGSLHTPWRVPGARQIRTQRTTMITFFRKFFQSKAGIAITLGFLGIIAFAFASSDVSNTGTFGGVSGGDRVAVAGDTKINTAELANSAQSAVSNIRRQNPTISMPAFLEEGGLESVLDQLIERASLSEFAEMIGLRAGTNLVNSEIMNIPAFRGADGNFSDEAYRQAISQQSLTDAMVRNDLKAGLFARQLLVPAAFGGKAPEKIVARYASLFRERREGAIAVIPAQAFAPAAGPSEAQLAKFYETTRGDYIRPERRVIRYFTFGDDALGTVAAPSEKEIAARYNQNKAQYAPSESRTITQLIVPTQQAANSIRDRVQKGGSLEAAAREAGLEAAKVGPITRSELASQTSDAVAKAVFEAGSNTLATPARSGLGFHVARIDAIDRKAGQTLAQARGDIETALRAEKRRQAMSDLAESIEEQVETGGSLTEIAGEIKAKLVTTKPITGAGQIYGEQARVDAILAPALQTAFQMEEGEPQLAEVEPGKTFLVYEVTTITPSAAAPLKDVRERVIAAWKLAEGTKLAKAAADRIMKRVQDGTTLAAAMSAEKVKLPSPDSVNLTREQLGQAQQVPPPLALMFSMAEGTTKRLEAPRNAGWFVVRLDNIEAGTLEKDAPQFAQAHAELSQTMAREYSDQLRKSIQTVVGVEKNETAIAAVRRQLTGAN